MDRKPELSYRCPRCSASIIWSMYNGRAGATADVRCANSLISSRIDWNKKDSRYCAWKGKVKRLSNGRVDFFCEDGKTRLRPFLY